MFWVDGKLPSSEERTHLSESQFPNLSVKVAIKSLCREPWRDSDAVSEVDSDPARAGGGDSHPWLPLLPQSNMRLDAMPYFLGLFQNLSEISS